MGRIVGLGRGFVGFVGVDLAGMGFAGFGFAGLEFARLDSVASEVGSLEFGSLELEGLEFADCLDCLAQGFVVVPVSFLAGCTAVLCRRH